MGAIILAASRAERFSMSFAHFYGLLLFAIPPGRPYTSFEKLFFPFKIGVWSCICILFLIAATVIMILKLIPKKKRDFLMGKSNDMPFFNMMNICLGGTINFRDISGRNFARTFLLIWLMFTLIMRNAYQGKLFDNLRSSQRKAPLFKLDELYKSNLKLYLYESFYQNMADFLENLYSSNQEYR